MNAQFLKMALKLYYKELLTITTTVVAITATIAYRVGKAQSSNSD